MTAVMKAEWLKLRTTRAYWGLIAGALLVAALGALSTTGSADPETLKGPLHMQTFWVLAALNIGLFALVVGIRSYTEEYRHRTIVHTFFADPHRVRSAVAKSLISALAAVLLTALAAAAMTAAAMALAKAKGGGLEPASADVTAFFGLLVGSALWAVVGVGIGALVRHQVAAIVGGILWVLVIENLGSALLGDVGRFLPGQAAYALARADMSNLLPPAAGFAVLLGYAAALWMAGTVASRRRDVA